MADLDFVLSFRLPWNHGHVDHDPVAGAHSEVGQTRREGRDLRNDSEIANLETRKNSLMGLS